MIIDDAAAEDLGEINRIYNHEVAGSTATFDTEATSMEARHAWFAGKTARHPVLVARDGGSVVGWACLSEWSNRCAYARAAEISIYVDVDHRGRGVGRALLATLIESGRAVGLAVLLARIVVDGDASRRLHIAAGFESIGVMHRVGEKFGRVLDVELLELSLERR